MISLVSSQSSIRCRESMVGDQTNERGPKEKELIRGIIHSHIYRLWSAPLFLCCPGFQTRLPQHDTNEPAENISP